RAEFGVLVVSEPVEGGVQFLDLLFQFALLLFQSAPLLEHFGLFGAVVVAFYFLQAFGDFALVDLVQFGKGAVFAAVFFFQFGELAGDAVEFGLQLGQFGLLFGEVAGNNIRLGNQVAGPAFVFQLALLFAGFHFFQHAARFGDPAVGGDGVGVVLHGFRPVVHQVLVDVVGIQ